MNIRTRHVFIETNDYNLANHYYNAIAKRKVPNSICLIDETWEILKMK